LAMRASSNRADSGSWTILSLFLFAWLASAAWRRDLDVRFEAIGLREASIAVNGIIVFARGLAYCQFLQWRQ
jgi:hypothetical protein